MYRTLLCALILSTPLHLDAQHVLTPEHERIDFLAGEWRTVSEFPDGRIGTGELEYRWVFGGSWMKVEFVGEHPDGVRWEAHVMQRWNPEEDRYESWVFRDGGSPLLYRGSSFEPGHYRIEYPSDAGVTSGIDYRRTPDGAVFQENWVETEGERKVTLRTTYQRSAAPVRIGATMSQSGAYGSCRLFTEAVRGAGTLDADAVRSELLALETTTVFGEYAVDERGYQIANQGVFVQWQDGRKVVVWPEELATTSPRVPTPPWTERIGLRERP